MGIDILCLHWRRGGRDVSHVHSPEIYSMTAKDERRFEDEHSKETEACPRCEGGSELNSICHECHESAREDDADRRGDAQREEEAFAND
jgi:hypothetical protein|tara:strand:- start:228 stop:494 length:267 start_codon:yes stop_codon:yes gene_type:complete